MNHVRLKSSSLMCQSDFLAHSVWEAIELVVFNLKSKTYMVIVLSTEC